MTRCMKSRCAPWTQSDTAPNAMSAAERPSRQRASAFAPVLLQRLCIALLACAVPALPVAAADTTGSTGIRLLDDAAVACANALPDFSSAGYAFGDRDPPAATGKIIDAREYGMTADDAKDDSRALLDAFAAAHKVSGPVIVQLPPGRIIVSEVLRVERGDFVLRGAGSGKGGTELYFPRPLKLVDRSHELDELREYLRVNDKRQVEKDHNVDVLFSEYSWSGGFIWIQRPGTRPASYLDSRDPPLKLSRAADIATGRQGQYDVTVRPGATLRVGETVQVRWFNPDGPKGALVPAIYGDTDLKIGERLWDSPERPLVVQGTQVRAIDGDRVTLASPLLHDIGGGIRADLGRWDALRNVGVEEIAFVFPKGEAYGHHQELGWNGIYMTGVFDGWARNLRFVDADTGILTYDSSAVTISDIATHGERIGHYTVHLGNVSDILVRDLSVFNSAVHSASVNTQSVRSVFLRTQIFRDPVIDQHAGANHQNLFDATTLHVVAQRDAQGKAWYPVWNGSGAPYWEPGHGRYNTTWNLRVLVEGGAMPDETVRLAGEAEGPNARIVGVSGNRPFRLDYRPTPYSELIGQVPPVPSLYEHQRALRLAGGTPRAPDCSSGGGSAPPAPARSQ